MGRSAEFSFSGSYPSQRTQQQQQHALSVSSGGLPFTPSNNQDLHLHGSDLLPSSHASYQSQVHMFIDFELQNHQQIPFVESYILSNIVSCSLMSTFLLGSVKWTTKHRIKTAKLFELGIWYRIIWPACSKFSPTTAKPIPISFPTDVSCEPVL